MIVLGEVMDVRSLSYPSNIFDLIIDKSTIDALLCGDFAYMNVAKMLMVIKIISDQVLGVPESTESRRDLHGHFLWNSRKSNFAFQETSFEI